MVELKTHKLWCQYDGCTHHGNSNGSGRENYSSCQTLYVLTYIGKWAYIYLLTLNKKRKMKIMGRVAWLIFVVVVSVCVVFCVLCCLQNNPVFLSVTIFHILKKIKLWAMFFGKFIHRSNYDQKKLRQEKKGSVLFFWPVFSNVTIFYMLKNENYETSIYSHSTRNEKWKLWVRWHGSSW